MLIAFFKGLFLGGSLIIAIGAQNAYVIRTGIRGRHVFAVATTCFVTDAVLISAGAAGLGSLIAQSAWLSEAAAWGGAVFLLAYGAKAAWAVWRPVQYDWDAAEEAGGNGAKAAVLAALAFSLLNPHVYLDTVVLIGGIAAQFEFVERIYFAVGATAASALWFYGTGYGATRIAPFFRTMAGQRLLDATICVVMWAVAASLIVGAMEP